PRPGDAGGPDLPGDDRERVLAGGYVACEGCRGLAVHGADGPDLQTRGLALRRRAARPGPIDPGRPLLPPGTLRQVRELVPGGRGVQFRREPDRAAPAPASRWRPRR